METLNSGNPIFLTYMIAASIMIIKVASMSWLTVLRMMKVKGGYRSPEDIKKTALNPNPSEKQLAPNDYVERVRRIHMNDMENVPFFLLAGFLFIFTNPSLMAMQILMYTYVVTRILHFFAYLTEQIHDVRAALWTPGSLIILYMAVKILITAIA
jgi:glutathione S-transferase